MNGKKFNELIKLAVLLELVEKCREIVQGENIVGGHRGSIDDSLQSISNEVFCEIERIRDSLKQPTS